MGFEQNEHRVTKLIDDLQEIVKNFVKEGKQENRDGREEVTNLITAIGFVFAKQISIIIKHSPGPIRMLDGYVTNCRDIALQLYNENKREKSEVNKSEFNNENNNLH